MADHLHYAGDLVRSDDAPPLALRYDLIGHLILLRLKDRGLV